MSAVEVCFECDIADCYHIRARRSSPITSPSPETRIVTVAQLELWQNTWHCTQGDRTEAEWSCIKQIRSIIGGQANG